MEWLKLFLTAFAVYRLAILITEDDGPLFVFDRLREEADTKAKIEQEAGVKRGKWQSLNDGLHCPYCAGMWVAIGCALLWKFPTWPGDLFLLAFGLAGMQSALQRIL